MPLYLIQTEQAFLVTYEVEADSPEEAWGRLLDGKGRCEDQTPDAITGSFVDSSIEEL